MADGVAGTAEKSALRRDIRGRMAALSPLVRAQEEELVNAALVSSEAWAAAQTLLLYHAKAPELSVVSAANAAFRGGKRVVFPRVAGEALTLHAVAGWDGLAPGAFGIMEPAASAPVVSPAEVDLAIVPGVAFTEAGDRLGQGGGFYDRLLPSMLCPSIGVAFDCQVADALPQEAHDVAVNQVVAPCIVLG